MYESIAKMQSQLSKMSDPQLANLAAQMSQSGDPGALFVAMAMKERADLRNGAAGAQAPQATVVEQLAQQLASPALSPQGIPGALPPGMAMPPQMPPQTMPPQMPPQAMPPQMPPQAMPPQMAMDQGVGSLPYEPNYEEGGIVSFDGTEGSEVKGTKDPYWAHMEAQAPQREDFLYDTLNSLAYLPALAADTALLPINLGRTAFKKGMVDLSPEGMKYAKETGRTRSREEADPTNLHTFSSGLSPFGWGTTTYSPNRGEKPSIQDQIVAQIKNEAPPPAGIQAAPFDPNRPPARMGVDPEKDAMDEKPADPFAGFSLTQDTGEGTADPFEEARRLAAQIGSVRGGGGGKGGTRPGDIKYTSAFKPEEMTPEAIKAEKDAFDKLMNVNPDFYKQQVSEYEKDKADLSTKAGSQRWMDLANAFLTMAQTPGSFGTGLAAGMDKGIQNLKLTNKELQDRQDKIKESQRLLRAQEEAERRGDSKTAYAAKQEREKINRQIKLDEEKANAEQAYKLYDIDERNRMSAAEMANRSGIASLDAQSRIAVAEATAKAQTQEKALDRAARERAARMKVKAELSRMGAKEREARLKAINTRVEKMSPQEAYNYILSKAQETQPGYTMDMLKRQIKEGKITAEMIAAAKRAVATLEMADQFYAETDANYGTGNIFDTSNPSGLGGISSLSADIL